jgi:hypothetical protein
MVRRILCLQEKELTVKKEEDHLKRNETSTGTE